MITDRQLIERFLELQEHPEQVSDEQLQQALDDPQMRELVAQMAFAKRAFKDEELQAEAPDVEAEWKKFEADRFTTNLSLQKIAASFIAILLVSGVAFAAIHIVRTVQSQKTETVPSEQSQPVKQPTALPTDTLQTDTTSIVQPVVFDNMPLEKMLAEIAAYYHVEVSFQNNDTRQLRFHFVWKRENGLGHAVEKLNRFESLSLRLENNKIIVE